MTVGSDIYKFMFDNKSKEFLNRMLLIIESNHDDYPRWDHDAFKEEALGFAAEIDFDWDLSAFKFFFKAFEKEVDSRGVHGDCRTWAYLLVIETVWPKVTGEKRIERGMHEHWPYRLMEWAKRKGYL